MEHHIIGPYDTETIGETPDSEKYERYNLGSKMMELAYFENNQSFRIYVKKENGLRRIWRRASSRC